MIEEKKKVPLENPMSPPYNGAWAQMEFLALGLSPEMVQVHLP